jgi:hypothetical protein
MVILATCIAGICHIVVMSRETSDRARSDYVAVNIAKNRIEQARRADFEHAERLAETRARVDESGLSRTNGLYRRSTAVSRPADDLIEIAVTVEIWDRETLKFGHPQTVSGRLAAFREVAR